MPFQPGHKVNAGRKHKPFADALRMELAAAGEDHKALRAIAKKLVNLAEAGDLHAIKELADRMDGRVPQAVEHSGDQDAPLIHRIERVIVNASNTDS